MASKGRIVRTNLDGALNDHGAVGLVDNAVDLLEVVRVRDDLVTGDNVLAAELVLANLRPCATLRRPAALVCQYLLAHLVDKHLEKWFVESGELR